MKLTLEEIFKYVPYTKTRMITPLLFEMNYYETMHKYSREQMIEHFEKKYITKEEYLKSRYDIEVK